MVENVDDYPLVGAAPDIRIPPRSVLASIEPMGFGTSYRESLSSYYLELAHIHHVSPKILAREIVVPRMKTGTGVVDRDNFILWKLPLFNGIGAVPETWANHLGELTGRTDLIDLTLVPLKPYTTTQRLMSSSKRWCPLCFSEAAQEGRVYGQLLWEIAAVEACPKHGIMLVSKCACNGSDALPKSIVLHLSGICGSCGRSLAQNYEGLIERAPEDKIKKAQLVADLFSDMERLKQKANRTAIGVPAFLKKAIRHFTDGNAALFGKLLGIKKNTLHGWTHGEVVPPFPYIVEIACACRSPIADIMLDSKITFKERELNVSFVSRKSFRTKGTHPLDRDMVKNQLEMLLTEIPPISVAEAAKKLGVNVRTLFRDFSNNAQKISLRYQKYRDKEKKRKFADRCELYRQSATKLIKEGIIPTPRLVGRETRGKRIILKGHEREACSAICENVIQKGDLEVVIPK
ncbi:MAG: TniQ family protein [Nitrospiraceae bacterium]|nr:TniQ family protein [Nitrospiraceae bacterium]